MEISNYGETLENLKLMFPGKLALNVKDTAKVLGVEKYVIYNLIRPKSKKKLPIQHRRIGRKVLFNLIDIAHFLSGGKNEK